MNSLRSRPMPDEPARTTSGNSPGKSRLACSSTSSPLASRAGSRRSRARRWRVRASAATDARALSSRAGAGSITSRPRCPSSTIRLPSRAATVSPRTPTTAGTPRDASMTEVWSAGPPPSVAMPETRVGSIRTISAGLSRSATRIAPRGTAAPSGGNGLATRLRRSGRPISRSSAARRTSDASSSSGNARRRAATCSISSWTARSAACRSSRMRRRMPWPSRFEPSMRS